MAIITTATTDAKVTAIGTAMSASVNFSGALMEMLSTVYMYILMAAIREAIQNACDAAKRKGLTYAEGVKVLLPTEDNPVITVIDCGSGMTREFMEGTYMSFGSSTKTGDNGSAGGLGVGRWAAYGYIHEAYIATTEESEMIERTFFQFQGPDAMPQVQLASEAPGKKAGTRVFFPVKVSDVKEAYRAVAWIKGVMQLTMGDSFAVDAPALLDMAIPEQAGEVFNLEEENALLKGIRVFPMMGEALQYDRAGLSRGSLVVMTNQSMGVGGLPFHVKGFGTDSIFDRGMVIEIPMSFNIPFMPSREEIKYTDEVTSLLKKIDAAAGAMFLKRVSALLATPGLASKKNLSKLFGLNSTYNCFASAGRGTGLLGLAVSKIIGSPSWTGALGVACAPVTAFRMKSVGGRERVFRPAFSYGGRVCISGGKDVPIGVRFTPLEPLVLVVDDLKTGGQSRFRAWLAKTPNLNESKFLLIQAPTIPAAIAGAEELNEQFCGELEVKLTSSFPAPPARIVGGVVVKGRVTGGLTYYSLRANRQETDPMTFDSTVPSEPVKVWVGKNGSLLTGFQATTSLSALCPSWGVPHLKNVLGVVPVQKLYLLTEKQSANLASQLAAITDAGMLDMDEDEFEDPSEYASVQALKGWMPLEAVLRDGLETQGVLEVRADKRAWNASPSAHLSGFCAMIAEKPRMSLTGSTVDVALSKYVDVMSGTILAHRHIISLDDDKVAALCASLLFFGKALLADESDNSDRKALLEDLLCFSKVGVRRHDEDWAALTLRFPALSIYYPQGNHFKPEGVEHFCRALVSLYK